MLSSSNSPGEEEQENTSLDEVVPLVYRGSCFKLPLVKENQLACGGQLMEEHVTRGHSIRLSSNIIGPLRQLTSHVEARQLTIS